MTVLSIFIVLLIAWIMIDFSLGARAHKRTHTYKINDKKKSHIHLFTEGHHFFHQLIQDLENAQKVIHFNTYIFRDDTIGSEILTLLEKKAKEGVTVRLLVDYFGSISLKKRSIQHLKESGALFSYSEKPKFPFFFFSINRRNHRKTIVIDHKIGYFGGFNVGDEYLGQKPKFGFWQDYHLRLLGEAVEDLENQFIQDWSYATNEQFHVDSTQYEQKEIQDASMIRIIPTSGYILEDLYLKEIDRAQNKIMIGSPYFIPSERLYSSLINALDRGVKISIILPLKRDHPFVRPASFKYFKELMEKGCRIFHFYQGFYHAKVFIIDGEMCHLGTSNFDYRSLFWNDEMNGFIYEKSFIQKIEHMTEIDFERSMELKLDDLKQRSLLEKSKTAFSSLLAPLL